MDLGPDYNINEGQIWPEGLEFDTWFRSSQEWPSQKTEPMVSSSQDKKKKSDTNLPCLEGLQEKCCDQENPRCRLKYKLL